MKVRTLYEQGMLLQGIEMMHYVKHGLKVMKIYHWKKQAKTGMNGNYLLRRSKLTKSCSEGKEVFEKHSKLI
jgi:hypothetical protein